MMFCTKIDKSLTRKAVLKVSLFRIFISADCCETEIHRFTKIVTFDTA